MFCFSHCFRHKIVYLHHIGKDVAMPHEWAGGKGEITDACYEGEEGESKGGVGLGAVGGQEECKFLSTQPVGKGTGTPAGRGRV